MIIDAHIHLWNRLHGDDLSIDRQSLGWGRAREGARVYYATPPAFEDSLSTVERAIAHMDWLGIDRAVVLQEFMDGKQDAYLGEVRRIARTRFSCMALFDNAFLNDPLAAFRRAVEGYHLQGLLIKTPDPFPALATQRLAPLWEACVDSGLPVVLKDGDPDEVQRLIRLAPRLTIVLSHFGGASFAPLEVFRRRLDLAASHTNLYLDTGALTYQQRFPFPHAQELLQEAVERVTASKIAWGSDYPRPSQVADNSYKQQLEFVTDECDFLTDAQRAEILGGTALRVYRWDD